MPHISLTPNTELAAHTFLILKYMLEQGRLACECCVWKVRERMLAGAPEPRKPVRSVTGVLVTSWQSTLPTQSDVMAKRSASLIFSSRSSVLLKSRTVVMGPSSSASLSSVRAQIMFEVSHQKQDVSACLILLLSVHLGIAKPQGRGRCQKEQ